MGPARASRPVAAETTRPEEVGSLPLIALGTGRDKVSGSHSAGGNAEGAFMSAAPELSPSNEPPADPQATGVQGLLSPPAAHAPASPGPPEASDAVSPAWDPFATAGPAPPGAASRCTPDPSRTLPPLASAPLAVWRFGQDYEILELVAK